MNSLLGFINLFLAGINLTYFIVNLGTAPVVLSAFSLCAALVSTVAGAKLFLSDD